MTEHPRRLDPDDIDSIRPAGWRISDRPLRIAILGWARLGAQGREGSGYNLSASELATGLVLSGHHVVYLRSGMEYSLVPGARIHRKETWRSIDCYSLINSRNLCPASSNFNNMTREIASPRESRLVVDWLKANTIEVVHIHSLEGFGLDLIGAIRKAGLPVVVTTHNYHYVCPQVDLLHNETDCCLDYDGGKRCVGCLDAPKPAKARRNRAILQSVERVVGYELTHSLRNTAKVVKQRLKRLMGAGKPAGASKAGNVPMPDTEAAWGFDAGDTSHDGTIDHGLRMLESDRIDTLGRAPIDANERFLESKTVHLQVLNEYGRRRQAGVAALNQASLVTPPSAFMCHVYETMGVDKNKLFHLRLGQPHFDQIHRRAKRSPFYHTQPWNPATAKRPLRVAFWGTTRNNKGFGVLARAIERLPREVRQRCQFIIHAGGPDWAYRKMLSRFPEVSFLGGYDMLKLVAGAGEYDVAVLPHIWFENSPLVMLEHLHAGKFIISSRLGGPVDWICEPGSEQAQANGGLGNGVFFAAGDDAGLAQRIEQVVRGDIVLPSPAQVHAVSTLYSWPEHVATVEGLYRRVLGQKGTKKESDVREVKPESVASNHNALSTAGMR